MKKILILCSSIEDGRRQTSGWRYPLDMEPYYACTPESLLGLKPIMILKLDGWMRNKTTDFMIMVRRIESSIS